MGDLVRRGTKEQPLWYIRFFDVDGTRRMRAVPGARKKSEAQEALAIAVANVKAGRPGVKKRPTATPIAGLLTVEQLAERFTTEYSTPKLKDPEDYRKEAASVFKMRVNPVLGKRPAASITTKDVEWLRDKLIDDDYAEASVNLTLATISKLYNWARKEGLIGNSNPTTGVERFKVFDEEEPIDEDKYFTRDEVRGLLAHAAQNAPDVHPMIATAIFTGMRKGELFGLRWPNVSFERGKITIRHSYDKKPKSDQARTIPINPSLAPILTRWQKRCPKTDEKLVFPVEGAMGRNDDMMGLSSILEGAGCRLLEKPWHALRHTFASHYMMSEGNNILELQKLLGHSSLSMTKIYAHLSPEHLAAGVARMSF